MVEMNNSSSVTSVDEYNQLKNMYQSEGFAVFLRLVDDSMNQLHGRIMDSKTSRDDVINCVNNMKGLATAKDICFNALKENESRFAIKG